MPKRYPVFFFLRLRELTRQLGMVLIFDEVKTGFRVALGGAQAFYGVQPDLTALGKAVGGGFSIDIVGGKRDILEMCSPFHSNRKEDVVFHSGTCNGNPISLVAGADPQRPDGNAIVIGECFDPVSQFGRSRDNTVKFSELGQVANGRQTAGIWVRSAVVGFRALSYTCRQGE
ncbi:aminotransferase class III-fold pyridoxal phosphate-dependent enzyme [Effusibacillus pohliae]|uniref:aminotransferase class III-fold pyridoxal phosphate-dependent enzyme n=1 Tax=Effusibacillus pohliae TaxID=232270 RepID=UPI00037AE957|nr:aminotransferase class III-fold pyridoxal phosphate-dependent enzyme [Effusibacillus pohliae]